MLAGTLADWPLLRVTRMPMMRLLRRMLIIWRLLIVLRLLMFLRLLIKSFRNI